MNPYQSPSPVGDDEQLAESKSLDTADVLPDLVKSIIITCNILMALSIIGVIVSTVLIFLMMQ